MRQKTIYVKVTERCNLHCQHCYAGCTKYGLDMSDDTVKTVINGLTTEFSQNPDTLYDVILHGGEPLLKPDYCEKIVQAFKPFKNVRMFITTNLCINLTSDILKLLKTIHFVSTSFDTKIRFKTAEQLALWKTNYFRLRETDAEVQINTTLTKDFISERPYLRLRVLNDFKADSYHFERLSLQGRGSSVEIASVDDVDDWLLECYEQNKQFGLKISMFEDFKTLAKGIKTCCFCRNCTSTKITINADGTVATCPNAYNTVIGMITNEGIAVNKQAYNLICLKERNRNPKCLGCEFYPYCNGDCFQQNWQNGKCAFPKKLFTAISKDLKNEKAV